MAVIALTWPTWVGLVSDWRDPEGASHGFLVAPIAAWLAWRALGQQPQTETRPAWWMLIAVAAVSFFWFFFRAATVSVLEQTAAIVLIWTTATAVLGWQRGRALLFPIGYLLVAIPVWDALVPVLQPFTSAAAGTACQLLGIPTYLDGNIVHIPNGVFEIEEGCAGVRFFVAAVAIAALYAHLEYERWASWLEFIGLAAALAIVGNWIRVVLVIRAGHTGGMQHPWVKDHADVGWVVFAVVTLVPLFAVARRLENDAAATGAAPPQAAPSDATPRPRWVAMALIAALSAAGWPHLVPLVTGPPAAPTAPIELAAPAAPQGWRGPLAPDADWRPASPPADGLVLGSYDDGDTRVTVFQALYRTQTQGREVIGYDTRIQGDEGWTLAEEDRVRDPELGEWRRAVLAKRDGRRRVVFYRYTVAGRPTASRLEAKLRQGLGAFTGDRSASVFAASTPCKDPCGKTGEDLLRFLRAMGSAEQTRLPS
jgi:exosortase A